MLDKLLETSSLIAVFFCRHHVVFLEHSVLYVQCTLHIMYTVHCALFCVQYRVQYKRERGEV